MNEVLPKGRPDNDTNSVEVLDRVIGALLSGTPVTLIPGGLLPIIVKGCPHKVRQSHPGRKLYRAQLMVLESFPCEEGPRCGEVACPCTGTCRGTP